MPIAIRAPLAKPAAARLTVVFLAAALISAAACDDPFEPRANTAVRTDSFVFYATTGTPLQVPTAFNIVFFIPVRIEPSYGFDFAFDIDEQGRVEIIPVRLMGGAVTAGRRVGLQKTATPFDDVLRAPNRGYVYDSVVVVDSRETVIVELLSDLCQFQVSQLVYSKLEILLVDVEKRLMTFRITYDPNCGFRSFLPGIPED
jgi:hypothetical protein